MTDHFAVLNEPRRPWLDTEALKEKFQRLSTEFHPDRVHGHSEEAKRAAQDKYTELNAAYTCLRNPKDRLMHLILLETGSKPKEVQEIPPEMTEWFFEVGKLCREVDAFLSEKAQATSPLLRVQLLEAGEQWRERVESLARRLKAKLDELEREAKELNRRCERGEDLPLGQVEGIYQLTSYYGRWMAQLQERNVQLLF